MTNTETVATENAEKVTETTCRECGVTIRSKNARMVACPSCSLIQYADESEPEIRVAVIQVRRGGTRHGLYARPDAPIDYSFEYHPTDGNEADAALRSFIRARFDGKRPRGVSVELVGWKPVASKEGA